MKGLAPFLVGLSTLAMGCATTMAPPVINTMYTASGTPTPRPDSAVVEVFMKDNAPKRQYDVLGQVEIATENQAHTMDSLLDCARAEARRLGGDALVGLDTNAIATSPGRSSTSPVYNLYNGQVIGYSTRVGKAGTRRVVKALVVKWREQSASQAP